MAAQTLPHLADQACRVYLGDAHQSYQARCRRVLRSQISLDPAQLHRFFHTTIGDTLLAWGERFFHWPSHPDDRTRKHALKDLLVQMAADPEGLSLLSFMRRFPDTLQVNVDQLLLTAKRVELLLAETDATLDLLQALSTTEAAAAAPCDFSQWADLRQPGPFQVVQYTLDLTEATPPHPIRVLCHQPQPWPSQPTPVIVQSHGLASSPEDLESYARHLASYGYFVVAPWHPGSDVTQVRDTLAGKAQDLFNLQEFIDRPLAISRLLDHLEHLNLGSFEGRLAMTSVGLMGYSFGAYTAFALAGAGIQFDRLEVACSLPWNDPNLSLLLQCQALGLPRLPYHLQDDRIEAIMSLDAVGSEVFGAEGMGQIRIPTLLMAGSQDIAAPLVFEQIRLFQGLTAPHRWLAVMQGKAHIRDLSRLTQSLHLRLNLTPSLPVNAPAVPFDQYINALGLAFFNQHLNHPPRPFPQISASYGVYLSQSPFDLWMISGASSSALQAQRQGLEALWRADLEEGKALPQDTAAE